MGALAVVFWVNRRIERAVNQVEAAVTGINAVVVGILAATRPQWDTAQLGILAAGGVAVGLDLHGPDEHAQDIARRCRFVGLIVDSPAQLGKLGDEICRTLRFVEAPLTAEQRAQRAIEEEKRKEQRRKDQALLNTYGNTKDIEAMRLRAQEDVQKSIKAAEAGIVEIRARRKKFENEAEFYKKKSLPADIQKGLRTTESEIQSQESVIAAKKKELDIIRLKYDEDLRRYNELNRRGTPPSGPEVQ